MKLKKLIAVFIQLLGLFTFVAGVVNLFVQFSDGWLMLGGIGCYFVGILVNSSLEEIEALLDKVDESDDRSFSEKLGDAIDEKVRERSIKEFEQRQQSRRAGFSDRLDSALEEQRQVQNKSTK